MLKNRLMGRPLWAIQARSSSAVGLSALIWRVPAGTGLPEVEEELVQAEIARDAAEAAYDH